MNIREDEKLALFIDGANLYAAARALGFDIDYKRLLETFRQRGRLARALYYTALVEDQEYSPIRPLVDWLDYNGYTMVTKPPKDMSRPRSANWGTISAEAENAWSMPPASLNSVMTRARMLKS